MHMTLMPCIYCFFLMKFKKVRVLTKEEITRVLTEKLSSLAN